MHLLDFTKGRAAFFGREPAWHALGKIVPKSIQARPVTVKEALEFSATDFDVATEESYRKVTRRTPDGDEYTVYVPIPQHRFTVRTDVDLSDDEAVQSSTLGSVGKRYTPLQNLDALRVVEPLIDNGVAEIVSAGALRGGRDVFLTVQFNIESEIVRDVYGEKGREVIPMGVITNNHEGKRLVRLFDNDFVVVCANTMRAAHMTFDAKLSEGRAFAVKHTLNVEQRTVEAAQKLWANVIERHEQIARQYRVLRATTLDKALFRKLVLDVAVPIPKKLDRANLTKREETSRNKLVERRERIRWLANGKGRGITGDGSAWEAYMALTESVDHDTKSWTVRGNAAARSAAVLDGRLANVKQRVVDALVSHAADVMGIAD